MPSLRSLGFKSSSKAKSPEVKKNQAASVPKPVPKSAVRQPIKSDYINSLLPIPEDRASEFSVKPFRSITKKLSINNFGDGTNYIPPIGINFASQKDFGTQIFLDNGNPNSGYWKRMHEPILDKGKKMIHCQLQHPAFPLLKFELQAEARKKPSSDGTVHGTVFSPAFKSETLKWRVIH